MPSAVAETIQYQAALQGNMFMAGSGALTIAAASFFRATLSNPAGSGRLILVHQLDAFSAMSATFAHLWTNPTAGIPATSATRPIFNCNVNGTIAPGIAVIRTEIVLQAGNVAMSGGFDTGIDFALGPTMFEPLPLPPIIIRPGQVLGMGAPIVAGVNMSMVLRWNEQAGT